MNEILEQLFESEFLNDETKAEVKQKFTEAVAAYREEVATAVRAELKEQFDVARDELVVNINDKMTEMFKAEISELHEDIASFRDLEVESAAALVAERAKLKEQFDLEISGLTDKLDKFLTRVIQEEFDELQESIEEVKKINFGLQIFESFKNTFNNQFFDENSFKGKLAVAESKLAEMESVLAAKQAEQDKIVRESKMVSVLSPLSGMKRDQMKILLSGVPTEKLEEQYNKYISRVLKDTSDDKERKTVISENLNTKEKTENVVVTGNTVTESVKTDSEFDLELQHALRIAGVK